MHLFHDIFCNSVFKTECHTKFMHAHKNMKGGVHLGFHYNRVLGVVLMSFIRTKSPVQATVVSRTLPLHYSQHVGKRIEACLLFRKRHSADASHI